MNLNIKKINLEQKILLFNGGFLIVIIIVLIAIIFPSVKEIKEMQSDINFQLTDLEEKYRKGQSLKRLNKDLKAIEPKVEQLNQIFINQNKELEFITALEKVASANHIQQKISLGAAQPVNNYKKIPLQISSQGSFPDLIKYMSELERLDYYLNIKNIEFTGNKEAVKLSLLIDSFWK